MATTTSQRARVARLSQTQPGSPLHVEARRELAAIVLEKHIQKTLEAAPPLSQRQKDHLTGLIMAGPATVTGATA